MKVKLLAGAEVETLTRDELREELQSWVAEIGRGVKWVTFGGVLDVTAAAAEGTVDGPTPGFLWAVTSVVLAGAYDPAADDATIYRDQAAPLRKLDVFTGAATNKGLAYYDVGQLVLRGGEKLAVVAQATGTGDRVFVSGQAVEVPAQLAYRLLG